jgi:hypothetical protein
LQIVICGFLEEKQQMNIYCHLWGKLRDSRRGQSLVEMAIAMPILVLMFIGVFEVGWALRGYLVLSNVNRESARFAVKPTVLNFSKKDPATVGYDEVLSHTMSSLARQLPLEFIGPDPNATIIMTHMVIDTGIPCANMAACDCEEDSPTAAQWFADDDLILHPDTPGYSYYVQTYGITRTTRLGEGSYQTEAEKLMVENNQLNCTIFKTGSANEISANNLFVAEVYYDQPQLLGVPLISNPLTDPIPFYAHTAMRITADRTGDTSETIGPVCELFPITFAKQLFTDLGTDADNPITGTLSLELKESSGDNDDFDWVAWNPAESASNSYLVQAIDNPRLAINDFTDLNDGDNLLSLGDRVANATDFSGSDIDDGVADLVHQTIQVPVNNKTTGNIDHIAVLQVTSVKETVDREITATFLRYEDQACEE